MFNPVAFDKSGFPDLSANVGSPYGTNLTPARDGMQNARGGPVFGLNSVSEPNTSPDVITVAGIFNVTDGQEGKLNTHIPSGTPILVMPLRRGRVSAWRHGEPLHMFMVLNVTTNSDSKVVTKSCFLTKAGMQKIPHFITVTVGDVVANSKVQHIAVAIQNVATVHVHENHASELKDVCVGDKLLLTCPLDGMLDGYMMFRKYQPSLGTLANITYGSDVQSNQRVLTVVGKHHPGTISCDLGNMVQTKHNYGEYFEGGKRVNPRNALSSSSFAISDALYDLVHF